MYRAKFLTNAERVLGEPAFHAERDDAAKTNANRILRTNMGMRHEILQDIHLVHREIYDNNSETDSHR